VYSVETDVEALDQIEALPTEALPFYAELNTQLGLAPWSGDPYNLQRPDANLRTHTFGPTPKAWRSTWSWNATAGSWSCESSGSPDRTC
jgi:hypothetical protein